MIKLNSKSKIIFFILILILVLSTFFVTSVNAATQPSEIQDAANKVGTEGLVTCHPTFKSDGTLEDDCDYNKLIEMVNRFIKYFIYLSTFISAAMFTWAGFKYFTAADNPSNKEAAKKTFKAVLTGLFFIYAAWLIVYTILNSLLSDQAKQSKVVNPLQTTPTSFNTLYDKNV